MTLLELQRRMAEDVRRPLTPEFRSQGVTENELSAADSEPRYIKPSATLTSFERLEIYNRQYWLRMIDAVSEDYPALNAVLGAKRFDAMIIAYLQDNPSTSFTLRNLGRNLPVWLDQHPELTGKRHVLAIDVAALEWAYVEAFDSAAIAPMSASDIDQVGPSTVLALQPHLQLVRLRYAVDELVLAIHRNAPEAEIVSGAARLRDRRPTICVPKMRRSPIHLAVHRYEDSVYYLRLTPEEYCLLSAIRSGRSVAAAVELAAATSDCDADRLATCIQDAFTHMSELGWIVASNIQIEP